VSVNKEGRGKQLLLGRSGSFDRDESRRKSAKILSQTKGGRRTTGQPVT
jgi:hypothetical protein